MKCLRWRALVAPFVLALLLSVSVAPKPRPTDAAGTTIDPGQIDAAVAQLDTIAQQNLAQTGVPGMAIAVVYKDKVVYAKGFGVREAGSSAQVDADTVFQLASVSKPVASTVIAALVGQGAVSWDDPIIEHDPGFQMYDPWVTNQVTLRDMFAHRSGLPDHAGDLLEDMGYNREQVLHRLRYQEPFSDEQIKNRLFDQKPLDPFRSEYAYTNFGLTEAAVAAANAAGKSWEDVSADVLYKPLGMSSTSSRHADFIAAADRAHDHVLIGGNWVAKYDRDPDAQSPAGGVSSSVRDMAQWLRLQLGDGNVDGRQIVATDALQETHSPQMVRSTPNNPSVDRAGFYGLGWNVNYDDKGRVQLGHSGAFALGAATTVYLIPAEQLGIIVLTNAAPIGLAEATALSFLDLAQTGTFTRDWLPFVRQQFAAMDTPPYGTSVDYTTPPAQPAPASADAAYLGAYSNDYYGDIHITGGNGSLAITEDPNQTSFPLQHYDRDTFTYQPVGENAAGLSAVTFTIGADGKAASVNVENLDIQGQGTFSRAAAAH